MSTALGAAALGFAAEDPVSLERALIDRARAGDARAFRSLFDRHAPAVRRFLGDLLRDADAADEATQETFVRAHNRLGTLRDDEKLRPRLFGIARFVFHETLRARRRDAELPPEAVPEALPQPTPEALLLGEEADRQLRSALAHLGEERRAALLLRIDHGLDYDEICAVMGWNLAKVKNEIHRARLELRARLAAFIARGEGTGTR
jgi:RNA polymerase sigma-70 factor (ECF subfamily)